MIETLSEFIHQSISKLEKAKSHLDAEKLKTIIIDHKYFDEKFMNDANISQFIKEFEQLKSHKSPIIYWFELENSDINETVRNKYITYREKYRRDFGNPQYRNTSSYKKKYHPRSRTLYVGKVEKGFWGRLVTHLGYNQSKKTAGMQLFHWYDITAYGNIKLNYVEFDPTMKHLIIILEKQLAQELKPLIGIY